jgi:hypothetical protein
MTSTTLSLLAATAASFVLAGTFTLTPANAENNSGKSPITLTSGQWKIDVAKSHFGPDRNTIVIERADTSGADANGASNTFVVVANGKVYLATSSEAYDTNGAKKIDYTRWKDMRLVQVGEDARSIDYCGLRCKSGVPENRLTLTFKSINGGMAEMSNVVVFNRR